MVFVSTFRTIWCTQHVLWTICRHFWVNWCKNECFWQRITCSLSSAIPKLWQSFGSWLFVILSAMALISFVSIYLFSFMHWLKCSSMSFLYSSGGCAYERNTYIFNCIVVCIIDSIEIFIFSTSIWRKDSTGYLLDISF